jgi:microcin C transport system substrate-binding protein
VQLEPDNSSITFHINPKARFSDDSPVTAEDVKYSYETLRDKGMPRYKHYFGKVESIEVIDTHTLKVTFKKNDKNEYDAELPMIICLVPVLQKQQLESIDFANSGLIPLIGTGPYKIGSFEVGRTISVVRNPDYWGKDLPLMRGQCNYDIIRVDYYKNEQAQRQAFLAGEFDVMFETNPNQFLTAYENAPAISDGRIVKTEMAHERPVAVRYFAMNMRRDKFHNWHFRKALTLAYDFDSINNIVFGKAMSCPSSLFANTFLAHKGKPQGLELEMLQGFEKQIDPELYKLLLEGPFECAKTKGNGDQRDCLLYTSPSPRDH